MKRVFCGILIVSLGLIIGGCEESNCSIIYHSNTDKALNRDIVRKSLIKNLKLQEPTREGYTFEGWYFDKEFTNKYDAENFSESNNELYAKWSINSYRVTVHNEDEEYEYLFEYGNVIDLNPVYKDDYDFDRYYFDEELTEEFNLVNMPAYDIDLYPKFNKKLHYFTIVYHPNNNEHYSNVVLERNELNNLVLPEPTREGYAFEGWFFDTNFKEPFKLENAQEGINELHGKWSVNSYKIIILNEEEVIEYNFNFGDPIKLNSIEKFDYAFEGFYLDEELTEEFTLVNMPSHNIYLFPRFSKILHYYTFVFRAENGLYYSPITLERDELNSLELPEVNKEGYTFDGWYLDSKYEEEFTINNVKEGNVELFAKWNVNSYKVVIHNEDEKIEYAFDYGSPIRVDLVEKYDHTFDGYFIDEELNIPFAYGNMPSHDIDLYPKFTKILHFYTFNYHGDNGVSYPSVTLERDILHTLELENPVKEGHTFLGWYLDNELTDEFDISKAVEGVNELYAKWQLNTYNVLIHNNSEISISNFNYGESLDIPEIRNYEHSFVGYYLEEECINKLSFITMPAYDLELYAKYCNHVWHKGDSCNYDVYCINCGYRSLPIVNIDTSEEITKDYVSTKVSVNAGSSYYDISNASCKVKVRGNGTATYSKKPYRLKFDQKQRMLGLNDNLEAKSWVLLAEWNGWFLKNFIAFNLAKQIFDGEYYSSDYCFVILNINNEYQGMYMLAEQQQVHDGRVDIPEPSSSYEGTDIGYLIEMDMYAGLEDEYFAVDYRGDLLTEDGVLLTVDNMNPYYSIKSDINCDAQRDYIGTVVQRTYDLIRDTLIGDHSDLTINPYKKLDENFNLVDDTQAKTAKEVIEKVIDYESLLRMMILSEICTDYDLGWSSFFINYDASKEHPKLVFEAPWDFDLGFDYLNDTYQDSLFIFSSNSTWHQCYNIWFLAFAHADWIKEDLYNKYEELDVHNIISNTIIDVENFVRVNIPFLFDNYSRWPDDCGFDLNDYDYFIYRFNKTAKSLIGTLTTKRENLENYLNCFVQEKPFCIDFVTNNGASIMVYEGKDFTVDGIVTNQYELADTSGGGQVNFKVIVPEGFEIESINVTGSYKNLKGPSDTGAENVYRVTKVASDLTIVVTLRAL